MRFIDERHIRGRACLLLPRVPGTSSFHLEVLVRKLDPSAGRGVCARAFKTPSSDRIGGIDAKCCLVIGDGVLHVAPTKMGIAAGNESPRQRWI